MSRRTVHSLERIKVCTLVLYSRAICIVSSFNYFRFPFTLKIAGSASLRAAVDSSAPSSHRPKQANNLPSFCQRNVTCGTRLNSWLLNRGIGCWGLWLFFCQVCCTRRAHPDFVGPVWAISGTIWSLIRFSSSAGHSLQGFKECLLPTLRSAPHSYKENFRLISLSFVGSFFLGLPKWWLSIFLLDFLLGPAPTIWKAPESFTASIRNFLKFSFKVLWKNDRSNLSCSCKNCSFNGWNDIFDGELLAFFYDPFNTVLGQLKMIISKQTLYSRLGVVIIYAHQKPLLTQFVQAFRHVFESITSLYRYLRSCSLVMSSYEVTSSMNLSSMQHVKWCASAKYFSSIGETASVVVVEALSLVSCSCLARKKTVWQYWWYSFRKSLIEAVSVC